MCVSRFGDGESCSVKSEELRGKLKAHNGNIMGLVSESRRRARGGRTAAVTLSYLKAALRGLGSQEETTAGPKQALEIHQQHNGCMWTEFITLRSSEVVSLQGCCSRCPRLRLNTQKAPSQLMAKLDLKSHSCHFWRFRMTSTTWSSSPACSLSGHGCTLSPHVTQQLSETEAVSVATRRQSRRVCG